MRKVYIEVEGGIVVKVMDENGIELLQDEYEVIDHDILEDEEEL